MVCIREKKKYWIWLFVVIVGHKVTWLASFPYTHITFSLLLVVVVVIVAFKILITVFGIRMMLVQIKHKFIFCIGQKWWCDRYNHTIGNAFLALLSGLKNFLFFFFYFYFSFYMTLRHYNFKHIWNNNKIKNHSQISKYVATCVHAFFCFIIWWSATIFVFCFFFWEHHRLIHIVE